VNACWKSWIAGAVLVSAGAGGLAGCKTPAKKTLKGEGEYVVTAKQTQVFRFGPAQMSGADAILQEGERVMMLRREYGYSRVMTEDGQPGFVANDAIAPAPPIDKTRQVASVNPFQNLPPLPPRGTSVPGVSSANRAVLQSDPLFGGPELPPLPDENADSKKPEFRSPKPKPGFRVNVPEQGSGGTGEEPKKE
jgi:hypothetical protein